MEPYVGEIRTFAFNQIPVGWMPCEGQTLTVQAYAALYSLIGVTYGGSAGVNFKLPDLRGRVMLCMGNNGVSTYKPGASGGAERVVLTASQVPAHTHTVSINSGKGNKILQTGTTPVAQPQVSLLTNENINAFNAPPKVAGTDIVTLNANAIGAAGANAAHENRIPYLAVQACIAITGVYPPRP